MTIHDISAQTIAGGTRPLAEYRGQVCLIVNVASACGFTPQYAGLEALYRKHRDAGLVVLGFPCNQFAGQEPGDNASIAQFCRTTYDVTFPLFAKVNVNGPNAHPLFNYLTAARPGLLGTQRIKWNFTKFLVGRDGVVRERFRHSLPPAALEPAIERLLRQDG
jgi:glutathione peroxidase